MNSLPNKTDLTLALHLLIWKSGLMNSLIPEFAQSMSEVLKWQYFHLFLSQELHLNSNLATNRNILSMFLIKPGRRLKFNNTTALIQIISISMAHCWLSRIAIYILKCYSAIKQQVMSLVQVMTKYNSTLTHMQFLELVVTPILTLIIYRNPFKQKLVMFSLTRLI